MKERKGLFKYADASIIRPCPQTKSRAHDWTIGAEHRGYENLIHPSTFEIKI